MHAHTRTNTYTHTHTCTHTRPHTHTHAQKAESTDILSELSNQCFFAPSLYSSFTNFTPLIWTYKRFYLCSFLPAETRQIHVESLKTSMENPALEARFVAEKSRQIRQTLQTEFLILKTLNFNAQDWLHCLPLLLQLNTTYQKSAWLHWQPAAKTEFKIHESTECSLTVSMQTFTNWQWTDRRLIVKDVTEHVLGIKKKNQPASFSSNSKTMESFFS